MQLLWIIGLCILASVVYGILHDQITARICVEYFTVWHPRVIDSESPTMLALVWGVIATWWVGLMLGVPLALAARVGRPPRMAARDLLKPIAVLLAIMGVCAFLAGLIGFVLTTRSNLQPGGGLSRGTLIGLHTAMWAHNASYLSGFIGGLVLIVLVVIWRVRARKASASTPDAPPSAP